jgi:nucleoside-diphosphate-sugar epimerase
MARAFLLVPASFCRHFKIKAVIQGGVWRKRGRTLSVLVTGAGGFIGSHVTRRLLADREEVHVLLREDASAERLAGLDGFRRWTGDLDDVAALESCLKGARPERIIHCAGVSRARHMSGWAPVHEAFRVNVDGLVNLFEAASSSGAPVRNFVRLGGLEEYGCGSAPFIETQREAPRSAYSASQVAGTHLLQALQPTLPFAAVTLRPTLIYGPGQSTDFLIPALIESLLAGRAFPLSEGRQRRDLLHIDDLVTAILAASTTDGLAGEVINIATGVAPKIRTVARAIGRMMGCMHLLKFGELPERPNDIIDLRGAASKAGRRLGWRPTIPLAHGLARTIDWHRSMFAKGCAA